MAKMGRPSKFSQELFDEICEWVSGGNTLASFCRDHKLGRTTVHDWIVSDEKLAEQFGRARDKGFDAIAEDTLEIIDTPPPVTATGGTDGGHVTWQKARVEQRMKLLAKWDPRRYGDKIDVNHSGNVIIEATVFGTGNE